MNEERLLKLADHLENGQLIHKEFDFAYLNEGEYQENGCGTSGCALGECPAIFSEWEFKESEYTINDPLSFCKYYYPVLKNNVAFSTSSVFRDAESFFGINREEAELLFQPEDSTIEDVNEDDLFSLQTVLVNRIEIKKLTSEATRYDVAKKIREFIEAKNYEFI